MFWNKLEWYFLRAEAIYFFISDYEIPLEMPNWKFRWTFVSSGWIFFYLYIIEFSNTQSNNIMENVFVSVFVLSEWIFSVSSSRVFGRNVKIRWKMVQNNETESIVNFERILVFVNLLKSIWKSFHFSELSSDVE